MNSNNKLQEAIVSYIPSPHRGYLNFFREHSGGVLYILGNDFIREFPSLVRNLPANEPEEVQCMVSALNIFSDVRILTKNNYRAVAKLPRVVMPDEKVSRALAEKYFQNVKIVFDDSWRLRWHWDAVLKERRPKGEIIISSDTFDREFMSQAVELSKKSPDWWRQIGAILVKDKKSLLAAFNEHIPSEQSQYLYGDPRSNFEAGQHISISAALHAEACIIATAAERNIPTKGCDIFVTTFPCPPCAYLIARSGIKRLFYTEGYSLVAGAEELRSRGVEIIRVDMK